MARQLYLHSGAMCGIAAYTGRDEASPVLTDLLQRLEYRGYDSAGLAVVDAGGIQRRRTSGRIDDLERLLEEEPVSGTCGLAHTRWATHGEPTSENAHPHLDCGGEIALVHNGIVENAEVLRVHLEGAGHLFRSETDTEVLVHLVEELWADGLKETLGRVLPLVEGTYGLVVCSTREPDRLVAARKGSPLLVGLGEGANLVASDPTAAVAHTRDVVYLDDDEIAVVEPDRFEVVEWEQMRPVDKAVSRIEWDLEEAERGGYPHFMLKEIHEQPESVADTLRGRILDDRSTVRLGGLREVTGELKQAERLLLLACGTSWHASLLAKYTIEEVAGLPVDVEYASEWRYREAAMNGGTVVVGVSQSGETADTCAAIERASEAGYLTLGVVNVVGSSLARTTDAGVYLHAGPEIGVASTKAFTSQVAALTLLAVYLARLRGRQGEHTREIVEALQALPERIRQVLEQEEEIADLADRVAEYPNFLFLGRGHSYPVALEGALKLKEISYLHAEGMSAAEMKHGPLALVDEEMPVVAVAPHDGLHRKVRSNLEEVRARGGRLVVVTTPPNGFKDLAEAHLEVPSTVDALQPVLTSIPLQLLAYHVGTRRGCDVDKPRNLAKSVTVE